MFQESNSNSIIIKLEQIKQGGIVTITKDDISINYEFSNSTSSFAQSTTKYKRKITMNELITLYSAINLLPYKDHVIFEKYQKCFKKAKEFQKRIQKLYKFGKRFVYEGYNFFNLIDNDEIIFTKFNNLEQCVSHLYENGNIKYPPFLTIDNLLYFGSLIQKRENEKIEEIVGNMIPYHKDLVARAINEAQKKEYIIDPVKSSIQMFSIIYRSISPELKFQKK